MPDRYQQVRITLSNGRTGKFVGKVLTEPSQERGLTVVDVSFEPPRDLPPDCVWESIIPDVVTADAL